MGMEILLFQSMDINIINHITSIQRQGHLLNFSIFRAAFIWRGV